jgi:hypothetical protein
MRRLFEFCREIGRAIQGILKELSDESAYERHLRYYGREHSPEEWRRFADAKLGAKFVRPKCC